VPRPANQSRRWAQAYLQIDPSLFSPSVSPKIPMVSASPSVNAGLGLRIAETLPHGVFDHAVQPDQTRSMLPNALKPWKTSLIADPARKAR
jgi:hypothetical protein